MDSDTFWNIPSLNSLWEKYDCIRKNKNIVIATEPACWIGKHCNETFTKTYYNDIETSSSSYSIFVNSGLLMGKATAVEELLTSNLVNNVTYHLNYNGKWKYDDQFAYTDYAKKIAPQEVALDYHQQLFSNFITLKDQGWDFVCKNSSSKISFCGNSVGKFVHAGMYTLDESTCLLYRKSESKLDRFPFNYILKTLSPNPAIWHGNGVGRLTWLGFADKVAKCILKRRNMTEAELVRKVDTIKDSTGSKLGMNFF